MKAPRRLPRRQLALPILVFVFLSPFAGAQDRGEAPPTRQTFTEVVDVDVVNVDVVVTDRSGKQITGLSREDFELKVDGDPVEITNFYAESDGSVKETFRPLVERARDTSFTPVDEVAPPERRTHVAILVDHTRLSAANRKRAFTALRKTLTRFDDDDLISVVGLEGSLVVYSDFLFDRQAIDDILDEVQQVAVRPRPLEVERRQIFGELNRGMSGGIQARWAFQTYDANSMLSRIRAYASEEYSRSLESLRQVEAVASTLAGLPGRKVLLYVGEGIPTRPGEGLYVEYRNRFGAASEIGIGLRHYDFDTNYNKEIGNFDLTREVDQLALAANRIGVTVYAIDAEEAHGGEIRSALTEQGATSETVSVIDDNFREPLEQATKATGGRLLRASGTLADQLADVVRDFDTFYSLGFSMPAGWEPGSVHAIDVDLAGRRRGVTIRHRTDVRVPMPDEEEAGATVAALMYQTVGNSLGTQATVGREAPRDDGKVVLPVNLEIPVASLTLLPNGDVHSASISIYVSVQDEDGNPGPVQKIPFHLNIPADKLEEAKKHSAHYVLPLVIRPGDRQAAVLVRDDPSGTRSVIRLDLGQTGL